MQPHPQRYGFEIAQRPPLPETAADIEAVRRNGFVVLECLIEPARCDAICDETTRLLKGGGRNAFEGFNTQRVYNVLTKTRLLDDLIDHPRVLALLDQLFEPNYLLSQAQLINICPGEAAQALHYDDGFYKVLRPRPALGAATIWAIDAFTEDNGATAIVPRSHDWGQSPVPTPAQTVPCVMPAGSAVFFVGTLWHGGGANHTNSNRLAFTAQYCAPWLRQQENFFLEIPRDTARNLRPTLQSLIGYSIYPPFMGMVDSMHPKRVLDG